VPRASVLSFDERQSQRLTDFKKNHNLTSVSGEDKKDRRGQIDELRRSTRQSIIQLRRAAASSVVDQTALLSSIGDCPETGADLKAGRDLCEKAWFQSERKCTS
jgi:hypothetical protein